MTGLAGVCGGTAVREVAGRMIGAIAPGDAARLDWADDVVGVAVAGPRGPVGGSRLAVDQQGGHPVVVAGTVHLDRREAVLDLLGVPAAGRGQTDAAVVAAAWRRWGANCLEHLDGEFAFALWDSRTRQLLLARDPVGTREVFYGRSADGRLAFAGRIRGVLACPGVSEAPDHLRIGDYLAGIPYDHQRTFYQRVSRVAPGSAALVSGGDVHVLRYWSPDRVPDVRYRRPEEYADAYRELFLAAVRDRNPTDGRVAGAQLSGGLDSSSVVCALRAVRDPSHGRLPVFSAVFPDSPVADERPYIATVVRGGGLEPHQVFDREIEPLAEAGRVLADQDEPFFNPFLQVYDRLFRMARAAGVDVMLDGLDGDATVYHGFDRLRHLAVRGRWIRMALDARAAARRHGTTALGVLRSQVLRPLRDRWVARDDDLRHLHPAVAAGLGLAARRRWLAHTEEAAFASDTRTAHARRVGWAPVGLALGTVERAAAAAGVAVRHPFADSRLVEFCLGLPPHLALHQGWTRWVARAGLAGILPDEIRWRPDKGRQMRGFVRSLVDLDPRRLRHRAAVLEHWVAPGALDTLADRFRRSEDPDAAVVLWRTAVLARWLEGPRSQVGSNTSFTSQGASHDAVA